MEVGMVAQSTNTYEAHSNVLSNDVYAGRKEEILAKRREKKRLVLEHRKKYNLNTTDPSVEPQSLWLQEEIVSKKGWSYSFSGCAVKAL